MPGLRRAYPNPNPPVAFLNRVQLIPLFHSLPCSFLLSPFPFPLPCPSIIAFSESLVRLVHAVEVDPLSLTSPPISFRSRHFTTISFFLLHLNPLVSVRRMEDHANSVPFRLFLCFCSFHGLIFCPSTAPDSM